MNERDILDLLRRVQAGLLPAEEAAVRIGAEGKESETKAPSSVGATAVPPERGLADLGFARVDLERAKRQGMPEVVFGENKSSEQIVAILDALTAAAQPGLVTRVAPKKATEVQKQRPRVRYNPQARTLVIDQEHPGSFEFTIAVVTAGTSDIPVAEEAAETLQVAGLGSDRIYDVGVAGIHRLFAELDRIRRAPAVIVCAGMEGALPSVLGGLVQGPVVAVPTSIGYGAALSGFTALLGMLTSCAAGITVVNIDNGFGAAMAMIRLLHRRDQP